MNRLAVPLLLLAPVLATPGSAATLRVPSEYPTINAAIAAGMLAELGRQELESYGDR